MVPPHREFFSVFVFVIFLFSVPPWDLPAGTDGHPTSFGALQAGCGALPTGSETLPAGSKAHLARYEILPASSEVLIACS